MPEPATGPGGAPPPATQRALRIGLVLGKQIVEEKLIRERAGVTIGQSSKNTFTVPVAGVPRSWPLFRVDADGRYLLRISEAMDGRVADGEEVHTFDVLKGERARRDQDAWVLPLSERSRGKIVLGSMTLLFQFVDVPAPEPPVELPASVRSRFLDRIDPTLAVVLAVSLLLHFGVALYAYQRDRVVHTRTTRIYNETFQRPTVRLAEIELEQPRQPAPSEEKPDKPEQQPAAKKSDQPRRPGERRRDPGEQGGGRDAAEELRLQEEARAAVEAMFGEDFSETGVGGSSGDRNPSGDLDAAMAQIRQSGARVEFGTGEGRGTRGSSTTQVGTSQGPGVEGPGETVARTNTKVTEKVPSGRIKVGDTSSIDDTTLRPEDVLRRIQQIYMDGLKRCHRELLKRDPSAGGTVTLRFAVGETGRVVRVKASGFDDGVDRCIEQRAGAWRFGVPKDEDGEPTSAEFKISLVLQPD